MTHLEQVKDKIKHFPSLDELKHFIDIPEYYEEGEPDAYKEGYQAGIESGALWQKEQVKHIMELSRNMIIAYHMRHPNEPQLLVNYNTEQALEKINAYLYGDNQP